MNTSPISIMCLAPAKAMSYGFLSLLYTAAFGVYLWVKTVITADVHSSVW